jgi:ATP-dependent Lon protease
LNDAFITNEFESIHNATPDEDGLIVCPVIPLANMIIYPNVITPIMLPHNVNKNGDRSDSEAMKAVQAAMTDSRTAIIVMRKGASDAEDTNGESNGAELNRDALIELNMADALAGTEIFKIGTEVALGQMMPYPDHTLTVLAQGRRRVEIVEIIATEPFVMARARVLTPSEQPDEQADALMDTALNMFQQVAELSEAVPDEVLDYALLIDDAGWMADFISSTLPFPSSDRQHILETVDSIERLREVAMMLNREIGMMELRDEINGQIQQEMSRSQREMYLREQMRVIQTELGEEDIFQQELNDVRQQIAEAKLPADIHDRAVKEMARLAAMPPMAPEVGIIRTYIDWLVSLPWTKTTDDNLDMKHAEKVLDSQHYGLPKLKDRILEHIAVRKLAADKMKTPILCFVGPPGVGKTSLGKSIATALGREFVRVSLGGVRDEAEIRGHRRTYIGAMPGRILQTMRRAGTVNPVFMLDEIDKIGADFRGDPSAALLEVLDPEQNSEYSDHYLDLPYDLSKVIFITTANELDPLPPALLDRLEVIEFPGYAEDEKLAIARQFLIPQQLEAHGLADAGIKFDTTALQTLVREYTYEAGVRNLNREIANICRKIARLVAEEKTYRKKIMPPIVHKFLGPPEFLQSRTHQEDSVGLVTGLAWTYNGGDTLSIEVSVLPGKGQLMMTGQLGEVMQESGQAAMSYMRSRASDLNVPSSDFEEYDVHVHLPEGAVPKDGPSAGITLAVAIISAFTERKVRSNFAMTGEITLRGRVLPIGGMKEKLLAAHRAQIKEVIVPEQNRKDLVDVPANTARDLKIHFVEEMQQVLDLVLLDAPNERRRDQLRDAEEAREKSKKKSKSKDKDASDTPTAEHNGNGNGTSPEPKKRRNKKAPEPVEAMTPRLARGE